MKVDDDTWLSTRDYGRFKVRRAGNNERKFGKYPGYLIYELRDGEWIQIESRTTKAKASAYVTLLQEARGRDEGEYEARVKHLTPGHSELTEAFGGKLPSVPNDDSWEDE